jgi:hypothetical protein
MPFFGQSSFSLIEPRKGKPPDALGAHLKNWVFEWRRCEPTVLPVIMMKRLMKGTRCRWKPKYLLGLLDRPPLLPQPALAVNASIQNRDLLKRFLDEEALALTGVGFTPWEYCIHVD